MEKAPESLGSCFDSSLEARPSKTDRIDTSHEGLGKVVDDLVPGERAGGHHVRDEVRLVPGVRRRLLQPLSGRVNLLRHQLVR